MPGPWIADASCLERIGLKGALAADWLAQAQIAVPDQPNTWASLDPADTSWSIVARLGSSEFFLEEDAGAARIRELASALADGQRRVYPVLREDRAFVLGGHDAESVLAQVCNVNFSGLALDAQPAVLTLMAGVAVLVVPQRHDAGRRYRIWCDPSFGHYLWSTLKNIVQEAGGEQLDIEQLRGGPRLRTNERKRQ